MTCPARTRLPSATCNESSVPGALARTMAVRGATSGPENSTTTGIFAATGRATSPLVNSSGTAALALSPESSLPELPPAFDASASAAAAATNTRAPPPHHHSRPLRPAGGATDDEIFMAASVGPDLENASSGAINCKFAGPGRGVQGRSALRGVPAQATGAAWSPRYGVDRQGPPAGEGGRERRHARGPEDGGKTEGFADGAAAEATDHAGGAVAQHRVERLAAASQSAGEVLRHHGDACGVLSRKRERMQALCGDEQDRVAAERGDHCESQGRDQGREEEPAVSRQTVRPAALEVEPADFGDN